jgi:hypothetical protein
MQQPHNRRTFLRHLGAVAALPGLATVIAACGGNKSSDTKVGAGSTATTEAPATTKPPASGASTASTSVASATAKATAGSTAATTTSVAAPPAGDVLTGIAMTVDLTYAVAASAGQGGGGRGGVRNPYVAVWLETADGTPVRTISLSYQKGKGDRWLPDLKRWYGGYQTRESKDMITSVTSATRVPGTYSYSWDGLDDSAKPLAKGDYVLVIEGAREKGPYSLAKQTVSLTGEPFKATVPDNGELKGMIVELKAA